MGTEEIRRNLPTLFEPKTVAVIGASDNPDKLGYHVMKSLTRGGYKGRVVPVNPGAEAIMDLPCVKSLADCGDPIDLAVIVVPAQVVPRIFRDCADKGVKGIVLITAGFKEIEDPMGAALQSDLAAFALEAGIPVIGPNTFGMINRKIDLNASFTPEFSLVEEGGVTLVSQSGGISHLLSFVAMREHVGISKIIGLGNRLNLDFAEVMPFLLDDPQTEVIVLYLEGLDDPRQLMSAVAAHRGKKPILALKAGRARSGDRASLSHTGSMAGRHEIYEGALAQSGILCVDDTQELMDLARAFSSCPLPEGPRTAVLTGQAGPGMVACDVCERHGLQMAAFQAPTQVTINRWLPPLALRTNPVDMGPAWYDADAIQGIIGAVMEDDHVDGVLLLMMFASANREAVPRISDPLIEWQQKKPLVTCLVSPPGIWDEKVIALERQGALVNLPTPERAAKVMARLWQYRRMI